MQQNIQLNVAHHKTKYYIIKLFDAVRLLFSTEQLSLTKW